MTYDICYDIGDRIYIVPLRIYGMISGIHIFGNDDWDYKYEVRFLDGCEEKYIQCFANELLMAQEQNKKSGFNKKDDSIHTKQD